MRTCLPVQLVEQRLWECGPSVCTHDLKRIAPDWLPAIALRGCLLLLSQRHRRVSAKRVSSHSPLFSSSSGRFLLSSLYINQPGAEYSYKLLWKHGRQQSIGQRSLHHRHLCAINRLVHVPLALSYPTRPLHSWSRRGWKRACTRTPRIRNCLLPCLIPR